ncbi:spermidine/putrescine transport system permease protein [Mycoplasmoides fastidiosum]|uniref:Spermidine/putrescine transport system permease protein n=1 Tax=Mycoplasmoides fastidiosum TaxID=92758 RepID=A0ABU0LYT2_9BACT|nr:ABC transporter permease [Mycoplasmoides fastidiosum]MDQ0513866.1 spermidine/putrescine transport system permease protein [Mycoplasmoides fastidiosum]UUD37720.1 ABC transporter permease [Mycoplasmoides fastidiosum]
MKQLVFGIFKKFQNPRLWLIIPFAILSLVLVIIPLIVVVLYALTPVVGSTQNNFVVLNATTGAAIWRSLWVSFLATFICLIIAYPFSYFLSFAESKTFKVLILLIITAPIWSSFLVKLIGLKSLLDIINGGANSTYGVGYSLLGLIYLYLPFAILPIYTILDQMPRNILNASQDLGYNQWETFLYVVLPYTKAAMLSAIIVVFLPSFTTVAVGQFLDNSNGQLLIGDINYEQGILGLDSPIALARSSAISLVISIVMFLCYGVIVLIPKIVAVVKSQNRKIEFANEFGFLAKLANRFQNKNKGVNSNV